MYDELIKRLRELQTITKHCGEQSCNECENRELCDKHDNKTLSGTYKEAADAIEELSAENESLAKSVNEASEILRKRWIPVTERLPDPGVFVLVSTRQKTGASAVRIGVFSGTNYGWSCGGASKNVVAWMPLPEPYEVS